MLTQLLYIFLAILSPRDADGLRRTAPSYLTTDAAVAHTVAARVAGLAYRVDPDALLAIAWRESRYQVDAVGPESGGRVSCGVMTPTPVARCSKPSMIAGYLAGAKHLREWTDACHGNVFCADTGFAGGYALIKRCKSEWIRSCGSSAFVRGRARQIKRYRAKPVKVPRFGT